MSWPRCKKKLDRYGAGVNVIRVKLLDVHPSLEVVDAFREVSAAFEEKNRLINEAEGYRNEQVALARGNAEARLQAAQEYKISRTERADGDGSRFDLAEAAFDTAPAIHRFRLYMETMEQVLPGKKKLILDSSKGRRHLLLLEDGVEVAPPALWVWDSKETFIMHLSKTQYRAGAAVAFLLLVWLTLFSVRETEFALITQFGKPVRTITVAGLNAKRFFQSVTYFDRRLRVYDPRPSEFLTRDKKNLVIESYVAWRIRDPKRFVETVGDPVSAEMRLHDIVWSGLSAALGNHDLDSIVAPNADGTQSEAFLDQLTAATGSSSLAQYGIDIVDVRIKRLNLPEQNKQSVYARMRAERERIARQYRVEGEEQALRIRADADRQRDEILAAAYKDAEKTRGEGDAASTRTYSEAYSRNPKFYKLVRTLEAYKKILDDKTTAILSSDSELLKVLMKGEGGVQ